MRRIGSIGNWALVAVCAVALGLGGMSPTAQAGSVIQFDPDGSAGVGTKDVVTFDQNPGNALLVGVISTTTHTVIPGVPFTVLYQATIPNLLGANGNPVVTYGATGNVPGELTIVGQFQEVITSVTPDFKTATLSLATDQTGSFFKMYYDTSANANNLAGTGFTDGKLIYTGSVSPTGGGAFSISTPVSPPTPPVGPLDPLDKFVTNNYPAIKTLDGSGGTDLTVLTTFFDPNFFKTDVSSLPFNFNTSVVLPFGQVDPSAMMFDGTPAATIGSIGAINGFDGPNELLQADANSSFQTAVPEPTTVASALLGLGLLGLTALRSRRNRTA